MKLRFVFLTLLCVICFSVTAQNKFQQEVITYLTVNGTVKQYNTVYDDMINVLKQQFANAKVPQSEWDALGKDKSKSVNQVIRMFASAYRKYFSEEEISQMSDFYGSEAGVQMRLGPDSLNKEQRLVVGEFYTSDLYKKVDSVKVELTADVSQVSEFWSRDLFNAAMNNLTANGYSPK